MSTTDADHQRDIPSAVWIGAAVGAGVTLVAVLVYAARTPTKPNGLPPTIFLGLVPVGAAIGAAVGFVVAATRGDVEPATLP